MDIDSWLTVATRELAKAEIKSARLDAELILAHTIRKSRTYLHAHGDDDIENGREEVANARLRMRIEHTPVAYIVGHKEFYGRQFQTTPATLIPRPESEAFITMLKDIIANDESLLLAKNNLIDVGTGTGCLGITSKLEWPKLNVTMTDESQHALNLASKNARLLGADVNLLKNNLLRGFTLPADIILANLPYVDPTWDVSIETKKEPDEALFARNGGLDLIFQLIEQSSQILGSRGHLLLESDVRQHSDVISYAKKHKFNHLKTTGLITHFVRN